MDPTTAGSTAATTTEINCQSQAVSGDYVNYATLPMLLLVILMSLLQTRKRLWLSCCQGRPGVLIPLNFVKGTKVRWAITAGFVILTSRLIALIGGTQYWGDGFFADPDFNRNFGFLSVFIKMINSVQLSICFYPLLACIQHRRHGLLNLLGILCLIPWLYYTCLRYLDCDWHLTLADGSGNIYPIASLIADIPEFMAYIYLVVFFIYSFVKNVRKRRMQCACLMVSQPLEVIQKQAQDTYYMKYVRALLKREHKPPPEGLIARMREGCTYRKIAGLKTSPRVLVTITVSSIIILQTACVITAIVFSMQPFVYDTLDNLAATFGAQNDTSSRLLYDYINGGYVGFYLCNAIALLAQFLNLWRVYVNYRTDLRNIYSGQKNILEYVSMSPADLLVYSMRYSGYQIVFVMYSYFVIFLILFVLLVVVIGFLIVLPLKYHFSTPVLSLLDTHWKTLIVSMAIYYAQVVLARFAFLRNGIFDNRRWYHVTDYFLFFFNALLGFFTSLKRIVVSAAVGMLYLSRLDQCGVMRGFETFDSGHKAYLGMLYMETQQNNPIVHAFVEILRRNLPHDQPRIITYKSTELALHAEEQKEKGAFTDKELHFKHMQMKWMKTITMVNNPVLVLENMSKAMLRTRKEAAEAQKKEELDKQGLEKSVDGQKDEAKEQKDKTKEQKNEAKEQKDEAKEHVDGAKDTTVDMEDVNVDVTKPHADSNDVPPKV